ncbi:MAG: hypothetical protein EBR53_01890 [Actinobacteria bacterium]|nr:hypothetical protein [Actinomycetota bacterium]
MATANTAVLRRLDANVHSLVEILEAFHRDGAVIVHNMLTDEVRNNLRSELAESMQTTDAGTKSSDKGVQEFWGSNTKRFTRLSYRSKTFRDHVLIHPILRGVADDELLSHCASYWMNTGQAMPAGSALIYSGTVLHGGGANITTSEWREGMHLSFLVGWLTPEEAGCVGLPEDIARTLSPIQQQLLGYRCYTGDVKAARLWTIDYEDIPVGMKWE